MAWQSSLAFKHNLDFTTIQNVFNDFLSLVLNSKEISPKKGSGKISKHFSTVNFNGDSVKTLSITFLKQEPINPDE